MITTLRYGREGMQVELPDEHVAHVLRQRSLPVVDDPMAATRDALAEPIGAAPLSELARGRSNACIVVSDLTRPVPNWLILPPILQTLADVGLSVEDVTLLVGTGLHRPNTDEELREMLGEQVLTSGCRIVNHVARNEDEQVQVGVTDRGIPALIDRRYVEADLKILTGLVEPHLMAGYSGGRKAICPGIAGRETIMRFHGPDLLEPADARAGNLVDNPVHEEALAVADLAGGADMIVNVTLDEQRAVTGVFAGEMRRAHAAAMARCEQQTKIVLDEPADIVVTSGGGYPLDLTLYQGTKGIVAAGAICRDGGTIVIAQQNAEGLGSEDFARLITDDDVHEVIRQALAGAEIRIDTWQLHAVEKVLRRCTVINVSELPEADSRRTPFASAESVEEAVERALKRQGAEARIAVMPEGPYVLACLASDPVGRMSVPEMLEMSS
ncbi:MAG: nickel-dependent lactate racemase [Armatimonadota bacterium]|nr:nickel-dependent lactate racemase [Armatimonadota bacterium]